MNKQRIDELIARHQALFEYQKSLINTHRRICKVAFQSPCTYWRVLRIGRKLIKRSRRNLRESDSLYEEVMRLKS